ncbi:MAG: hypothetical protein P8J33_13995 [Pirellulaceae bacterium]|nr:hypothetical protein [Pirellulaceae bacterium]
MNNSNRTDSKAQPMNTSFQIAVLLITTIVLGWSLPSVGTAQENDTVQNRDGSPTTIFSSASRKKSIVPARLAAYRLYQQEIPADANHTWQKTPEGWQQVPMRSQNNVHVLTLPHEPPRVHPFSIASLILLLTLAAMTWASSEWDWCRLIGAECDRETP